MFKFLDGFSNNIQISNFVENHTVGENLLNGAEGRSHGLTEGGGKVMY